MRVSQCLTRISRLAASIRRVSVPVPSPKLRTTVS